MTLKFRLLCVLIFTCTHVALAGEIFSRLNLAPDTVFTNIDTSACTGTLININGVDIEPNSSAVFFYLTASGEDSVVSVTVYEKMPVERNLDSVFCVGQAIEFANLVFTPFNDTTLTATFMTVTGCDSVVHLQLTRRALPTQSIRLTACRGNTVSYAGVDILAGTTQSIQVSGAPNCDTLVVVQVDLADNLVVNLAEQVNISAGDSIRLQPTVGAVPPVIWTWAPAEGLSCQVCQEPTASPVGSTRYVVTATDATGCTGTASVAVLVDDNCPVFAPNIISLNQDGKNDWFILYGSDCVEQISSLTIYDRWGSIVYQRQQISLNAELDGWDGKVRGRVADPGVYIFRATLRLFDGRTKDMQGDFTVLR